MTVILKQLLDVAPESGDGVLEMESVYHPPRRKKRIGALRNATVVCVLAFAAVVVVVTVAPGSRFKLTGITAHEKQPDGSQILVRCASNLSFGAVCLLEDYLGKPATKLSQVSISEVPEFQRSILFNAPPGASTLASMTLTLNQKYNTTSQLHVLSFTSDRKHTFNRTITLTDAVGVPLELATISVHLDALQDTVLPRYVTYAFDTYGIKVDPTATVAQQVVAKKVPFGSILTYNNITFTIPVEMTIFVKLSTKQLLRGMETSIVPAGNASEALVQHLKELLSSSSPKRATTALYGRLHPMMRGSQSDRGGSLRPIADVLEILTDA